MESLQCAAINQLPEKYGHLSHEDCPGLVQVGFAGTWEKCTCWHHDLNPSPTILTVVCAWCGKDMGSKPGRGVEGVSHGICAECEENLLKKRGKLC